MLFKSSERHFRYTCLHALESDEDQKWPSSQVKVEVLNQIVKGNLATAHQLSP